MSTFKERATCWCVVINNPTANDEDCIAKAKQRTGWSVQGQLEVGESGTPHYQLCVKTPQVRHAALVKAFPRAYVKAAISPKGLENYCAKEDTRAGALPKENDKFPTMERFYDLFYTFYTTERNNIDSVGIETPDTRLQMLDNFVYYQIEQGSFVESFAVNPQIRSSVKKYLPAIFTRCQKLRRQKTDRQTELNNVEVNSIEDESSSQYQEESQEDAQSQTTSSTSQSSAASGSSFETQ